MPEIPIGSFGDQWLGKISSPLASVEKITQTAVVSSNFNLGCNFAAFPHTLPLPTLPEGVSGDHRHEQDRER